MLYLSIIVGIIRISREDRVIHSGEESSFFAKGKFLKPSPPACPICIPDLYSFGIGRFSLHLLPVFSPQWTGQQPKRELLNSSEFHPFVLRFLLLRIFVNTPLMFSICPSSSLDCTGHTPVPEATLLRDFHCPKRPHRPAPQLWVPAHLFLRSHNSEFSSGAKREAMNTQLGTPPFEQPVLAQVINE